MPNIYNPIDLSELDVINAQVSAIKNVLPVSNGALVNTEENAIDVVGKALKDGSVNNSGVEILYNTVQDANNEISIRLKSTPNTIFYADQTGLLVPLTIGNGLTVSNGDLNTISAPRSKIKNKLLYTTTYQHADWFSGLSPENLYNGEGGSNGVGAGESGMIAANTSVVAVTVNFATPKWLNKFKLYLGEPNTSYWAEPHLVEVFAGNTTEVFLSSHSLRPSTVETIDISCLESYTSAGKQTQYTFKFTSVYGYVSLRELVLWGDDGNTGNSNTGNSNTGNSNTGNSNTGNSNTGNSNTGNSNTRSTAKNKLSYVSSSSHDSWHGGSYRNQSRLNDGEGGSGVGVGEDGMLAENTSVVDVTVTFSAPKWLNEFKIYPGQYNGSYNLPDLVQVFAGNNTQTLLSSNVLDGTIQTIDTSSLALYTAAGKQTQYTFRFSNSLNYVAVMELVLWGDD